MVWNELQMEGFLTKKKRREKIFNQMLLNINKIKERKIGEWISYNETIDIVTSFWSIWNCLNAFIKLQVHDSFPMLNFYEFFAHESFFFVFRVKLKVEKVFCLQTFSFSFFFLIFYAKNYTFCVMVHAFLCLILLNTLKILRFNLFSLNYEWIFEFLFKWRRWGTKCQLSACSMLLFLKI